MTEAETDKQSEDSTNDDASKAEEVYFLQRFDRADLVCLLIAGAVGGVYLMTKHWIANNMFGLSFALNGIDSTDAEPIIVSSCIYSGKMQPLVSSGIVGKSGVATIFQVLVFT